MLWSPKQFHTIINNNWEILARFFFSYQPAGPRFPTIGTLFFYRGLQNRGVRTGFWPQNQRTPNLRQRTFRSDFCPTKQRITYNRGLNVLCFYPAKTGRSCNLVQFVFQSSFQSIFLSQSFNNHPPVLIKSPPPPTPPNTHSYKFFLPPFLTYFPPNCQPHSPPF